MGKLLKILMLATLVLQISGILHSKASACATSFPACVQEQSGCLSDAPSNSDTQSPADSTKQDASDAHKHLLHSCYSHCSAVLPADFTNIILQATDVANFESQLLIPDGHVSGLMRPPTQA